MFLFCFSSRSSRGAGSENIYAFGREACLKTQLMSVGCCPHLPHLLSSTSQQPTQSSLPTRTLSQPFCWAPVRNLRVDKSHKVCTASYPDPPPACSCCCCRLAPPPSLPTPLDFPPPLFAATLCLLYQQAAETRLLLSLGPYFNKNHFPRATLKLSPSSPSSFIATSTSSTRLSEVQKFAADTTPLK